MKKLDNYSNCLNVLRGADYSMAASDEIYRTGVIGQFNLTFELAWKALQEALRLHGVREADTGSPREILQIGYRSGFVDDETAWLAMLKERNTAVHIYNEDAANQLVLQIRDCFIPAFCHLKKTLTAKLETIGNGET